MNPLTVVTLLACLVYTSAQLVTNSGSSGQTGLGSSGSAATSGGPLDAMANPTASQATGTASATGGVNQMLSNPLLSYGMMGGDNMMRALMAPYMSRFGNTAGYYWLRGGMDKFTTVLMSDMVNRMLARSTGMNPVMSAFMTGQMFDAPDNYALNNMLFNGMGAGGRPQSNMMGRMNGGSGMFGGATNQGSPNNVGGLNALMMAPFFA